MEEHENEKKNKKHIKNQVFFDGFRELWDEEKLEINMKLKKIKNIEKHNEEKVEKIKNIEEHMEEKLEKNKEEQITDFFASLKKAGSAIEQKLNQQIQYLLNNEDLVKFADGYPDLIANNLSSLQKYVEVLSTILLFPTKNDVANVAKLTLQTEEKVDKLVEYIIKMKEAIEESMNKDLKE